MFYSIIFVFIFALISLLGTWLFRFELLAKNIKYFLALSAGALIADAFLHLLPHALENQHFSLSLGTTFLAAVLFNFLLESYLRWRECCQRDQASNRRIGILNLVGDCMCNFIDGISLVAAFAASPTIGFATGIAILLHEIPQEISDFATLLHSGFSKKTAIKLNIVVSLFALIGVLFGHFLISNFPFLQSYMLVFAAGSITYLSLSTLIPEVHSFHKKGVSWISICLLILGMLVIGLLALVEENQHAHEEHEEHEEVSWIQTYNF